MNFNNFKDEQKNEILLEQWFQTLCKIGMIADDKTLSNKQITKQIGEISKSAIKDGLSFYHDNAPLNFTYLKK